MWDWRFLSFSFCLLNKTDWLGNNEVVGIQSILAFGNIIGIESNRKHLMHLIVFRHTNKINDIELPQGKFHRNSNIVLK